ncbi:unnamed protein product [marine sediment metagenome]|uniref:Uncharacterized protein n=1 Tax=marine sediment metagenome TaxID=412755 RepID=X0TPZ4_9ZZZZ
MSGRILRATLAENDPTMLNVTMTTNGKLLIKNAGNFDLWVGYDQYDVTLATGVNYFVIDAGVTFVFDASNGVGFLSQDQGLWFASQGGAGEVQIWVANER